MHIGIDGGCWSNRRGYGRFLRELLEAVVRAGTRHRFTVFLDAAAIQTFSLPEPFRARLVRTSQAVSDAATAESRRSAADLARMSCAVASQRLDWFFFPSVYSYFPLVRPVRTLLGIHDTIADKNPRFAFASRRQELFWRWKVRLALRQAHTVLTVSEYSKRCVAQFFGIAPERIRVLYEASSPRFSRLDAARKADPPFALYVGGISPNKNLARLIRAYALSGSRRAGLRLVLVGDYQSDGFKGCYRELTQIVAELRLESCVEFAGFVPDERLCALYNSASMFLLPSLDEGFGLPAIEAMACGLPVVVSTGNSLEEIVGDAGLRVDPLDEAALAAQIDRIFRDSRLAADLSRKAVRRAAEFSWDAAARQFLAFFDEEAAWKAHA